MRRRPFSTLTVAGCAIAIAFGAQLTSLTAPSVGMHVAEPEADFMNLNLRLVDLPPGYEVSSDFYLNSDGLCLRSVDHGTGVPNQAYPYLECDLTFGDNWVPPGVRRPREVGSASFRFDAEEGAIFGFRNREYLSLSANDDAQGGRERVPAVELGDEAREWSWDGGAMVAWRSGNVLAFVGTSGPGGSKPKRYERMLRRAALRLAIRQQARIAKPTPLLPSDNYDAEVALDSPRMKVAVRWLGLSHEPGGGLPRLELFDSASWHGGAGWSADMIYVGQEGGVSLTLWRPQAWKRVKRSVIGARIFRFSCTKPQRVRAPGQAIVYSTRDRRRAACDETGNHFFAIVHYRDLVATINMPDCVFCVGGWQQGVFNSASAAAAIARGLHRR